MLPEQEEEKVEEEKQSSLVDMIEQQLQA